MKTILTTILALLLMSAWVEATLVLSQAFTPATGNILEGNPMAGEAMGATVVPDSVTLALTMLALMLLALAVLRWAWRAKASAR